MSVITIPSPATAASPHLDPAPNSGPFVFGPAVAPPAAAEGVACVALLPPRVER